MPNYLNAKKTSPKTHSLKTVKSQWQIILKAARETRMVTHKGTPIRLSVDFLAETLEARRRVAILKILKEKLPAENTLSSKVIIQIWRRRKGFPRHTKAEGIHQISRVTIYSLGLLLFLFGTSLLFHVQFYLLLPDLHLSATWSAPVSHFIIA